jgi:hypothetical protein
MKNTKQVSTKLGRGKYKRTKSTLLKLSKSLTGKKKSPETIAKMKSKKRTPETIEKLRNYKLGKKRPPRSEQWKKNSGKAISEFWNSEKGIEKKKEVSVKHSKTMKGKKNALGCKHSEVANKKKSERMIAFYKKHPEQGKLITQRLMKFLKDNPNFVLGEQIKGEKNPNWAGGVYPYNAKWSDVVRPRTLERDNHTCQQCLKKGSKNLQLDVHHINGDTRDDRDENLITLCHKCHIILERAMLKSFLELLEEMYMEQFNIEMPISKKEEIKNSITVKKFEANRIKK